MAPDGRRVTDDTGKAEMMADHMRDIHQVGGCSSDDSFNRLVDLAADGSVIDYLSLWNTAC